MSDATIRKAFETRIAIWAAGLSPVLPIAYENHAFIPPANKRYGRCFVLPGQTSVADLGATVKDFVGVFQLTLVLPINKGTADSSTLAQSLDTAFPAGQPMLQDGLRIWIVGAMSMGPALPDPDSYRIPVSAPYRAIRVLS